MAQRADEFRKAAAQCLALAGKARDPSTRAMLLLLAQKWHDALGLSVAFETLQERRNRHERSRSRVRLPADQIPLLVGFVAGYGVRDWISRRRHRR